MELLLPMFPSKTHLAHLRHACRTAGLTSLSDEDRWFWHAYVYGFRRAILESKTLTSPIDTLGRWYDENLATAAEHWYRSHSRVEPNIERKPVTSGP